MEKRPCYHRKWHHRTPSLPIFQLQCCGTMGPVRQPSITRCCPTTTSSAEGQNLTWTSCCCMCAGSRASTSTSSIDCAQSYSTAGKTTCRNRGPQDSTGLRMCTCCGACCAVAAAAAASPALLHAVGGGRYRNQQVQVWQLLLPQALHLRACWSTACPLT